MSYTVNLGGTTYTLPDVGETAWGTDINSYFAAIATGTLQKNTTSFTLTAGPLDFGTGYGIKALYFSTKTTNPAATGVVRLAKTDAVVWRNDTNTGDLALTVSGGNIKFNGIDLLNVTDQQVLEGKTIDLEPNVDPTKTNYLLNLRNSAVASDASISYSKLNLSGSVVNADINAAAGIAYSKLNLTGSIADSDLSPTLSVSYANLDLAGSIVNDDIKSDAAIAGTKISPDFGPQSISSSGNLVLSGITNSVTVSANPSEDVALALPATQGLVGQSLVQSGAGQLGWATMVSALAEDNVFIGNGLNELTQVDTSLLGDIAADVMTGLTIKAGIIDNDDISALAEIAQSKISGLTSDLAGKEPIQTKGSISTTTTGVTVNNGTDATVGPNVTVDVSTADSTTTGLLTAADWSTFNGKLGQSAQMVYVAKSGANFTSIQSAINSILDASPTKPYVVRVAAGYYTESIVLKDWVCVSGEDINACIIHGASSVVTGSIAPGAFACMEKLTIDTAPNSAANVKAISVTGDISFDSIIIKITPGSGFVGDITGIEMVANDYSYLSNFDINLLGFAGTIQNYVGVATSGNNVTGISVGASSMVVDRDTGHYVAYLLNATGDASVRYVATYNSFLSPTFAGTVTAFKCTTKATLASNVRIVNNCAILNKGAGGGTCYAMTLDSSGNSATMRYDGMTVDMSGFTNEYISNTGSTDSQKLWITSTNKDFASLSAGLSVSTPQDQNCSGFVRWGGAGSYWSYVVGTGVFTLLRPGAGVVRATPVIWAENQTVTLTNLATNYVYVDSSGVLRTSVTDGPTLYKNNIVLFEVWTDGTYYQVTKENHPYEFTTAISGIWHKVFGALVTGLGATVTQFGAASARTLSIVGDDEVIDHGLSSTITGNPAAAVDWSAFYTNVSGKMQQRGAPVTAIVSDYNNAGVATNASSGQRIVKRLGVLKDSLNSAAPIYVTSLHTTTYGNDNAATQAISNGQIAAFPAELKALEVVQLGYIVINADGAGGGSIITGGVVVSKQAFGASLIGASSASQASLITTNTTNFVAAGGVSNSLSGADVTVQAALDTLARSKASRYAAAISWTGAGPYTMSIAGATHLRGTGAVVQVMSQVSGNVYENAAVNVSKDIVTGDVVISSTVNFVGIVDII